MSDNTGFKTTLFSAFSDERLYSFFREESWKNLDEGTKQQLCQEVVNREAQSLGMVRAPEVSFSREIGNNYGVSGRNQIQLNARYFVDEQPTAFDNDGNIYNVNIPDVNLQALNTLFHENQHTYQEQIVDNEIEIDDPEIELQYRSNDFTRTSIQTENGLQTGYQYLSNVDNTKAGYYAYYLQSTERDAYVYAEKKTAQVREMLTEKYGDEPSFQINRIDEKLNGYQATLEKAKAEFGNENIEKEINRSLVNHRFNTNYAVDPKIDKFVEHEMIRSYQGVEKDKVIQTEQNEEVNVEHSALHDTTQITVENETAKQTSMVTLGDNSGNQSNETTKEASFDMTSDSVSPEGQSFDGGISDGNDFGSQDYCSGFDGGMDGGDSGMGM